MTEHERDTDGVFGEEFHFSTELQGGSRITHVTYSRLFSSDTINLPRFENERFGLTVELRPGADVLATFAELAERTVLVSQRVMAERGRRQDLMQSIAHLEQQRVNLVHNLRQFLAMYSRIGQYVTPQLFVPPAEASDDIAQHYADAAQRISELFDVIASLEYSPLPISRDEADADDDITSGFPDDDDEGYV